MDADVIIVGAGSAGCVLASRLAENASRKVLLIEAGSRDWNPWIHIPVGYFRTMHNPAVDWCYRTAPDPGIAGRSLAWPRGRVLGGSSSINGLLYVRGQPQDYDGWGPGWSWAEVAPVFASLETFQRGPAPGRGQSGPLQVSDPRLTREICDLWVEAAQACGLPANPDYNGLRQEGVGYFQMTANRGLRSSATVFLKRQANLRVMTGAQVRRLVIEEGRAQGVELAQGILRAPRVVLSAGSIGSPQLLMLSGIGPGAHLAAMGIPVLADLPVGEGLQDHLQARLVFKTRKPTLNDEVRSLWGKARIAAEFALLRRGPMTMAASLAVGFARVLDDRPDIQFHIQPWSADSPGEGVHPFSAFTQSVCQLRPESRGRILLASPDPRAHPVIQPSYLATETDQRTLVEGIKLARRIARAEPLAEAIAEEFRPRAETPDAELLAWARENSTTIYHPTGTCGMGRVVDHRLAVKGIAGLWVADASVMPHVPSGNTNAPAMMVGARAAEFLQ